MPETTPGQRRYEAWIDRGGTFTDCILYDRHTGTRTATKVLSSDSAPVVGLRQLFGQSADEPLPPCDVKMGTTVATNALLERRGKKTALIITQGFGDVLELGDQTRPDLFALAIRPRTTLDVLVLECRCRLTPDGRLLSSPSEQELDSIVSSLAENEAESVALVLLHATKRPETELELARELERRWTGSEPLHISTSSSVCPEQGLLARASTTVLDAYVRPLLTDYLTGLERALPGSRLRVMQSAGGLAPKERLTGPQAILSGPAGGIVAAEHVRRELELPSALTLDMGGTSTDVSLIRSRPLLSHEVLVEGLFLRTPMIDIHTVAAGGGSVCDFDGYRLIVGPASVGADPGPLCYGKALGSEEESQLSVTDVNVVLGRVTDDYFPFPLHPSASLEGLVRVASRMGRATDTSTLETLASDFSLLVNAHMAEALRSVCLRHGVDATESALIVFGGAAGQHACAIARRLGVRRIVAHRLGGVFSALGMGMAPILWSGERDGRRRGTDAPDLESLAVEFAELEKQGQDLLEAERSPGQEQSIERTLYLRYQGTESALPVAWAPSDSVSERFHDEHSKRFGYARPEAALECTLVRVEIRLSPERRAAALREDTPLHARDATPSRESGSELSPTSLREQRVYFDDIGWRTTPVREWEDLTSETTVEGPLLLLDATSTYVIEPGFRAKLQGDQLQLEQTGTPAETSEGRSLDAELPLLSLRVGALAAQMGETLRRSASSTNIRDRLDYSCAVFDHDGQLVANAPHIPVHLGAMSETVRAVLERHPHLGPGDAIVSNDPRLGGSHLPDITVVTPVFTDDGVHLGFTASRGHHADVGGITPGSMPAFSRTLDEEGIVLSALPLVQNGEFLEERIREVLLGGPYPARKVDENLADLQAQLAANRLGARLLRDLATELGTEHLRSGFLAVRQLATRWTCEAIRRLPDAPQRFTDRLDDGTALCLEIRKAGERLVLDFTGTGRPEDSNLNAPRAVTVACVLYALRVLIARPLPLNDGCLAPIDLILPPDSLLAPTANAAVAGGNVETSSRVCDLLFAALGLSAASQGTMNNLSFGDGTFGYYETIAGGTGAGRDFPGAHAVHSHMTNTRITDPEVLEDRFPVRLIRAERRRGSGGTGRYPGGDGVIRELEALVPLEYSLMMERRVSVPFGLEGGGDGAIGRNSVDGRPIPGRAHGHLLPGQRLVIETPGGGGFGPADPVT